MKKYLALAISLFLFACSSLEKTTQESAKKEPQVYVFDDVSKVDTTRTDTTKVESKELQPEVLEEQKTEPLPPPLISEKFLVQVGAYSTKERAETFINENQSKIQQKMEVFYSEKVKLFIVQLPPFPNHKDAEKVKDNIRQIPAFKDAFVTMSRETK
ncbi:MAG: SPOR domain-containing protein [Bacteroidetes bacterium]|nr:SPOR domain-containing protein [Bacteroidota bacterium]